MDETKYIASEKMKDLYAPSAYGMGVVMMGMSLGIHDMSFTASMIFYTGWLAIAAVDVVFITRVLRKVFQAKNLNQAVQD